MWPIDEANVRDLTFAEMTPDEVLYDFDGPRIFTFKSRTDLYFACWSDENSQEQRTRYLVVPTATSEIQRLKAGGVPLDRVLDKDFLWTVDRNFENQVIEVQCLRGGISSIPDGFKPEKGTLLWDHLEPEKQTRELERKRFSAMSSIFHCIGEPLASSNKSATNHRMTELRDAFHQSIKRHFDRNAPVATTKPAYEVLVVSMSGWPDVGVVTSPTSLAKKPVNAYHKSMRDSDSRVRH